MQSTWETEECIHLSSTITPLGPRNAWETILLTTPILGGWGLLHKLTKVNIPSGYMQIYPCIVQLHASTVHFGRDAEFINSDNNNVVQVSMPTTEDHLFSIQKIHKGDEDPVFILTWLAPNFNAYVGQNKVEITAGKCIILKTAVRYNLSFPFEADGEQQHYRFEGFTNSFLQTRCDKLTKKEKQNLQITSLQPFTVLKFMTPHGHKSVEQCKQQYEDQLQKYINFPISLPTANHHNNTGAAAALTSPPVAARTKLTNKQRNQKRDQLALQMAPFVNRTIVKQVSGHSLIGKVGKWYVSM